jgi:hypothetical protein
MMSTTKSIEIAKKYQDLRTSTGEKLRSEVFNPTLSVTCSLGYNVAQRAPDGPIFKSRVMEEKWDIYLYDDRLYFCRSWGGELIYRAALECAPPALRILMVETSQKSDEKAAIREVDFLIKSHVLSGQALHPLPRDMGRDPEKLALFSFSCWGRMGMCGTFEETIGTLCYTQPVSGELIRGQ